MIISSMSVVVPLRVRSFLNAISTLDTFLATDSQNKEALEYKALLLERVRRFTAATQTAKTVLMLGGEESKYLDIFGRMQVLSGDFDGAEATIMRAYKLDPDSDYSFGKKYKQAKELSKLKREGNDAVAKGKVEEAIAFYTTGIERAHAYALPCAYVFLNNRSACYINSKRFELALSDIESALKEYPYLPKPYLRMITCVKQLRLTERTKDLPALYLNALYTTGYKEANAPLLSRECVRLLKESGAFRSRVQAVGSKSELDRVLAANPNALVVLDLFASWCGPCKVGLGRRSDS